MRAAGKLWYDPTEAAQSYYMQPTARSTPLNVMVKASHMQALDRIVAATPGVDTRSAAVRMLIEQAAATLAAKA